MINWYTNITNRAFVIIGYEAKSAPRLSGCCQVFVQSFLCDLAKFI